MNSRLVSNFVKLGVSPNPVKRSTSKSAIIQVAVLATSQVIVIGQVLESDIAQPTTVIHRVTVNQALESDLAQHAGNIQRVSELQALESDLAQQTKPLHRKVVTQVVENDLAQSVSSKHVVNIGQVQESDNAQQVKPLRRVTVAQSNEIDSAFNAGSVHRISESQAIESDVSQSVKPLKIVGIGQALESDLAQEDPATFIVDIGQALEENFAQSIGFRTLANLQNLQYFGPGDAFTTEKAAPIKVTIGQAVELSLATPVGVVHKERRVIDKPLFVSDVINTPQEVRLAEPVFSYIEELPTAFQDEIANLVATGII